MNVQQLYLEGYILLSYVQQRAPKPALVERYVDAIHYKIGYRSIFLPMPVRKWPALLCLWEPLGKGKTVHQKELIRRLQFAVSLAETDPSSADIFCEIKGMNFFVLIINFSRIFFSEVIALPFRIVNTFLGR